MADSPAIDLGTLVDITLPDAVDGASANRDAGAIDSPIRVIDGDFPRLAVTEFDLDPPERWPFPGNSVAPPPPDVPDDPGDGSTDATADVFAAAANFTSKDDDRTFNTFYEASVDALGGNPESSGLDDLQIFYQGALLPGVSGRQGNPDRTRPTVSRIQSMVNSAADIFVVDIEAWFPTPGNGTERLDQAAINNYQFVGQEINKVKGDKRWAWYSLLPLRTLFGVTRESLNAAWKLANDDLAIVAAEVDFLTPSVYAFDTQFNPLTNSANAAAFRAYVFGNVEEARRIGGGKPLVLFLWTSYHNFETRYISSAGVREMLNIVLDSGAEGVDIWQTSSQRRDGFSQQNIWYQGWLTFRDDRLDNA